MERKFNKWTALHLRALANSEVAGITAHIAGLLFERKDPSMPESKFHDLAIRAKNVIDVTDRTLKGNNLGIILTIDDNGNQHYLKSLYDNYDSDCEKLLSTGRKVLNWFPINFASYDEYRTYIDELQLNLAKSFISKQSVAV